ncbi:MAG: DUF2617 family protein [Pseudonocardia sp.]|nr:DUF2617 family protein [Pseudonocardia sp.]
MSVHRLDVQPRDVTPAALGLLLDAPAPETLVGATLRDGHGGLLTLGVLGASHVVTATAPGVRFTEQVSCDAVAGGGTSLPHRRQVGGYRVATATRTVPRADLERDARILCRRAEAEDSWLCATFPGAEGALTALAARNLPGHIGWIWHTWHLYPGEVDGVIVSTRSRWVR